MSCNVLCVLAPIWWHINAGTLVTSSMCANKIQAPWLEVTVPCLFEDNNNKKCHPSHCASLQWHCRYQAGCQTNEGFNEIRWPEGSRKFHVIIFAVWGYERHAYYPRHSSHRVPMLLLHFPSHIKKIPTTILCFYLLHTGYRGSWEISEDWTEDTWLRNPQVHNYITCQQCATL